MFKLIKKIFFPSYLNMWKKELGPIIISYYKCRIEHPITICSPGIQVLPFQIDLSFLNHNISIILKFRKDKC